MAHDDPYKGKTIDPDWAYDLSRAQSYNPELAATTTDPDLGEDGVAEGAYHLNGHLVTGWAAFLFDGTGHDEGSGDYTISLPVDADSSLHRIATLAGSGSHVGSGFIRDNSDDSNSVIVATYLRLDDPTRIGMRISGGTGGVSHNNPFTFDENDRISVFFTYVADPDEL